MNTDTTADHCDTVIDTVSGAVIVERETLETVLSGFLARGHVLLEDVPGTGKTLTARSLAGALGLSFSRIQFTPDLLPADVTGTYVFDEQSGDFQFRPGPIFGNVVLADEINRASPKTQAALLEAMAEGQVTIEGRTHELPDPFFVIATQNPIEQDGTFPLPEAQVDRFVVKTSLGYPDETGERELVDRRAARQTSNRVRASTRGRSAGRPKRSTSPTRSGTTSSTWPGRPARTVASRPVSPHGGPSDCSRQPGRSRSCGDGSTSRRTTSPKSRRSCWPTGSS